MFYTRSIRKKIKFIISGRNFLIALPLFVIISCNPHINAGQYIRTSESQWAESVSTNDTSVLVRILAEDFIWVYPDGSLMTKQQAIDDAKTGPGDYISDHLNQISIRFYGNTAVAQGSETWERKHANGNVFKGRFVWTDTWVQRHKLWQIVAAEDINVLDTNSELDKNKLPK
jgi:hypothetical protein